MQNEENKSMSRNFKDAAERGPARSAFSAADTGGRSHSTITHDSNKPRTARGKGRSAVSSPRRLILNNSAFCILNSAFPHMPYVELRHPSGAQLDVYLHGAHATSWRDKNGNELLFLSEKSLFKRAFPIRGGIPVIFPQFGDGPLPKHGFARIREWTYLGAGLSNDGWAEAGFELKDNEETINIWQHKFRLELVFRLKATELEVSFSVRNTGQSEFEFKNGLHTYFAVADIGLVSVQGLAGAGFIDFLGDRTIKDETREKIIFDRETDRVYPSAPDKLTLDDGGNRRQMIIEKRGMNDVVIWNPWIEKSKRMEDFGDLEYTRMVCVETGNLHDPVSLKPNSISSTSAKFIALSA